MSSTADALLIATGGMPRQLPVPGGDLPGVYTLRSMDDCEAIVEAARAPVAPSSSGPASLASRPRRACATAASRSRSAAPEPLPLVQVFGEDIGQSLRELHERHGVAFQLGRTIGVVEGSGRVAQVQLDDGTLLPADWSSSASV